MTYNQKLQSIRRLMQADGVDAYIIPSSDPHMSEYVPERFRSIEYASGFTGSAGTLIITLDSAGLWTDGRYFVQATEQLHGSEYQLMPLKAQGMAEYIPWLGSKLVENKTVAFDGNVVSVQLAEAIQSELKPLNIQVLSGKDYLEKVWENRPQLPANPGYLIPETIAGATVDVKLSTVREALKNVRADHFFISSLDDIAWLFNLRGSDVKCNPLTLAFAVISSNRAILFLDQHKIDEADKLQLAKSGVVIKPYSAIESTLSDIQTGSVFLDPQKTCFRLFQCIKPSVTIVRGNNLTTRLKAIKNTVEIENTRRTMIKDGIALTRFFKWLEENAGKNYVDELSVAEKLHALRSEQKGFIGDSFDTIAAYREHGALPHYKATSSSNAELKTEGLFLLDSGGQYMGGTTDVTRVVSLGNATEEEKTDYTLVLKGMIEGSTASFPRGTRGYQIDAITRKPLWDHGRNYAHGTGHGVGYFLNVHEGPQVFNAANIPVEIEPGMITSVEPGLYRAGNYGIRIENLVLTTTQQINEFAEFYSFETLTVAFIDTTLVIKTLLDDKHISWLNSYNQWVLEKLRPFLTSDEVIWLESKTKAL